MTPKRQARGRIERAAEQTFPERTRSEVETTLVNDFFTLADCGALTGAQLLLIERILNNLGLVLRSQEEPK